MSRLLLVVMSLALATACSDRQAPAGSGKIAITDSARLQFIDGQQEYFSDYQGKLLLVNFWSVSCAPCFKEMPDLIRLQQEFAGTNFNIIAIAMPYDRPDLVITTRDKKQLPYPIALDTMGDHSRVFQVTAVPTSFLLSEQGTVLMKYTGPLDFEQLRQTINTHFSNHSGKP